MELDPEYFDELADMHEGIATELRNVANIARTQAGIAVDYIPNTSPTPSIIDMDSGYATDDVVLNIVHPVQHRSHPSMFILSQGRDINALKKMMRTALLRDGSVGYRWDTWGEDRPAKIITRTEDLDKIQ